MRAARLAHQIVEAILPLKEHQIDPIGAGQPVCGLFKRNSLCRKILDKETQTKIQ